MLRVVEYYVSYQGEGPNTTKPTVFVRFAGCNFKCPGWPCDTQHAIDPKIYRGLQQSFDPVELAEIIHTLGVRNICLTGGEVFLQQADSLFTFVKCLFDKNAHNIECFTNGALHWPPTTTTYIDNMILDWKLPGSGEEYSHDEIIRNIKTLTNIDAVKFTIKDDTDYREAKRRYEAYIRPLRVYDRPMVYAGVVWGQDLTTERLCNWMMQDKLPWHLNVQVHKFVWSPDKTGV